jgi:hypothetical protein
MATTVKWGTPTARTTGIAAEAIAAGANFLGAAIDNATNRDRYLSVELVFTCAEAPTAGTTIELYILPSEDGTNYADGAADLDPASTPTAIFTVRAVTTAQRPPAEVNIPIPPKKFKLLLKSEMDKSASCTLTASTYNEELA